METKKLTRRISGMKDITLSVVKAPRCTFCGHRMQGYDEVRWICKTPNCVEEDVPVNVAGIYPISIVTSNLRKGLEGESDG